MRFELINPSDPYTFEADNMLIAAVAVCLLGNGRYPADALGEDANLSNNVPAFLFGGHDEWFTARFGGTFEAVTREALTQRGEAVVQCLRSVTLGRAQRSSLNDIGKSARLLADQIERLYVRPRTPEAGR